MAESCSDGCCQIAFCTVCGTVMEPIAYFLHPEDRSIVLSTKLQCSKCKYIVQLNGGKLWDQETAEVSTKATIRELV